MYRGYIKSWRKVLSSNMYQSLTASQRDVFWTVLHLANHEDNEWEWQGTIYKCKPGQFISSLSSISKLCAADTTTQNIRTALDKLKKWQFLTNLSTKSGRLITIVNWSTYQDEKEEPNKKLTKNQQRANKELTTNKNVKNDKKVHIPSNGDGKKAFREYVKLKPAEHERLLKEFGKRKTNALMDKLDGYIGAIPKKRNKYTDHNRVLRGWVLEQYEKDNPIFKTEPEEFL
jgi:hypothetical protein